MTDPIQSELFEDDPGLGEAPGRVEVPLAGVARVLLPNRGQVELRACDLEIYTERAATAECVNAQARERGLTHLRLRGTAKVRCVLLLHALAHNLMLSAPPARVRERCVCGNRNGYLIY